MPIAIQKITSWVSANLQPKTIHIEREKPQRQKNQKCLLAFNAIKNQRNKNQSKTSIHKSHYQKQSIRNRVVFLHPNTENQC